MNALTHEAITGDASLVGMTCADGFQIKRPFEDQNYDFLAATIASVWNENANLQTFTTDPGCLARGRVALGDVIVFDSNDLNVPDNTWDRLAKRDLPEVMHEVIDRIPTLNNGIAALANSTYIQPLFVSAGQNRPDRVRTFIVRAELSEESAMTPMAERLAMLAILGLTPEDYLNNRISVPLARVHSRNHGIGTAEDIEQFTGGLLARHGLRLDLSHTVYRTRDY